MPTMTSDQARERINRRWAAERTAALDRYVEQVITRSAALTDEQRARIAAAVTAPASAR